jgi:beta-lactamase regulating signal transducer with metallopeptidase domain
MSFLRDLYPGDRALEFFLIVALGVIFLSTAAWVVAWRLPKKPAARHLVLISALFGCLAMPVMEAAFSASGVTLISIPLLPAKAHETDSITARATLMPVPAPGYLAANRPPTQTNGKHVSVDLFRSDDGISGNDSRAPAATFATTVRPGSAAPRQQRDLNPAGRSAPYRANATLALFAWGCGSVVLLLRLARSWLVVNRLRGSSNPVHDASLPRLMDDFGRALGIRRLPRVCVSPRVLTPLAFGLRRPIIVLPDRLIGSISDAEMRDVLLHEMAHVSRRDPLIVFLQEIARALYWPIVPVHALMRELGRAREELCDNHVLKGRDALSYGETLLHLAELSQKARPLVGAVGIVCWRGELERRIAGFLDQGRNTMTRSNRWLANTDATDYRRSLPAK